MVKHISIKLLVPFLLAGLVLLISCVENKRPLKKNGFLYHRFRDSLLIQERDTNYPITNVLDSPIFIPGVDSLDEFLEDMDAAFHRDAAMLEEMDSLWKRLKRGESIPAAEKLKIRENIRAIDTFFNYKSVLDNNTCRQTECFLYALVIKSKQKLYLYIEGELKDSFLVSTGMKDYTTPNFSSRASGPVFTKYTSRKFPGGNYMGLGNMPYVVFVKGGYAIHGTTPGNFSRLGRVASHGCIRLHPDNARVFYELVKVFGLSNTWVTVKDYF